jgi:hypothetical protein
MITKGKYLTVSDKFVDTSVELISAAIWRYHVTGIMGIFIDHEMTVRIFICSTPVNINSI